MEITAYVSSKLLPGTVSIGHGEWSKFDNVRKSKLMPYGIDEAGNCNLLIGDTHLPHVVGALLTAGLVEIRKVENDMAQYGFFFDQGRCYGCKACSVACKDWYDIAPGPEKWMSVYMWEKNAFPLTYSSYRHPGLQLRPLRQPRVRLRLRARRHLQGGPVRCRAG